MTFAGRVYISLVCAEGHEENEPAAQYARWWHLLWFLVPIAGVVFFVDAVDCAAR